MWFGVESVPLAAAAVAAVSSATPSAGASGTGSGLAGVAESAIVPITIKIGNVFIL